jgi:hypothetical protein
MTLRLTSGSGIAKRWNARTTVHSEIRCAGPEAKTKADSQKWLSHYFAGNPVKRNPALWTL